jgi:hypothetical protein
LFALRSSGANDPTPPAPAYTTLDVEGWQVHVNQRLQPGGDAAEMGKRALALLRVRLYEVKHVVPDAVHAALLRVPIWIEVDNDRQGPGACYHPSPDWLEEHGFERVKGKAIEICRADNFVNWSHDQPAMLLHELAHAFHDQVLDFEEPRIKAAWERAKESGFYNDVLHISGQRRKHYGLENHKEFFAEMTEAYFGTNDFYPFVRAELKECDLETFKLLEEVWSETRVSESQPKVSE